MHMSNYSKRTPLFYYLYVVAPLNHQYGKTNPPATDMTNTAPAVPAATMMV